ncbi:hypothetical protein ACFWP5_04370 [Streptomyces sp. NPDC058469]|uniref:hypothetical protein n=1 Tax=Streptomyces sp. NPDC058469 TaxID=3346514 RepID=UPI0036679F42
MVSAAEALLEKAVITERAKGTSWEVIGEVLGGVSKSAAQKRWGTTVGKWRESAEADPRYDPSDGPAFSKLLLASSELEEAWQGANEIVQRQPLLADLNNATAALSGSPDANADGERQANWYRATRLSHLVPPLSSDTSESTKAWLAAACVASQHELSDLDRAALLNTCSRHRDPDVRTYTLRLLAEWSRHQESTQRHSVGGLNHQLPDDAVDLRERHPKKLTLEERVTNLERAFGHLLSEQAEGP